MTDANGCSETASVTDHRVEPAHRGRRSGRAVLRSTHPGGPRGFSPPGGTWSGNGITDPGTGTFLPSDVGPGVHEVVYTFTDGNGCQNTDTTVVEVIVPQVADAGPDLSICDIDTVLVLDGFSPVTASGWTGPGVTDPAGTVDAGPLGPGDYTLTYTIGTGTCESVDTRNLEVRPLPAIALSADDVSVCDDSTVVLSAAISGASAPYSWSWNPGAGGATGTGSSTSASAEMEIASGNTFTATLTATDATGCVASESLTVDVLALPNVDAGGDTVFCNTDIPGVLLGFSPGLNEAGTGYWTGLLGAAGAVDAKRGLHARREWCGQL